ATKIATEVRHRDACAAHLLGADRSATELPGPAESPKGPDIPASAERPENNDSCNRKSNHNRTQGGYDENLCSAQDVELLPHKRHYSEPCIRICRWSVDVRSRFHSLSCFCVESGLIHSDQNVYTEYPDPRRDEWKTKILPAIKELPLSRLVA